MLFVIIFDVLTGTHVTLGGRLQVLLYGSPTGSKLIGSNRTYMFERNDILCWKEFRKESVEEKHVLE